MKQGKRRPTMRLWIIGRLAAGILLAGSAIATNPSEPTTAAKTTEAANSLQKCAGKALRGEFGKLSGWQMAGYKLAISCKSITKIAWLTTYCPQEGFWRGKGCRWGIGTSERVAAANLLPAKTYLWISNPPHLRQVWDTGAKWNDQVARRKGADLWIDLWVPRPGWKGLDTRVAKVFIITQQ